MIRNNISVFLTTKNQDDHHIVLSMLSDVLKKRKYLCFKAQSFHPDDQK